MIPGGQRDDYRRVFVEAWRKHTTGGPLEPLERAIVEVIDAHPEYRDVLADPEGLARDYPVEEGETNPFLHMGMHITIVEQVTSDRPPGIRDLYDSLRRRFPDSHALEHAMMQCLAESLWEAQARGGAPDQVRYLACVRRLESRVL